jgi:hypothetical protein
MCNLSTLTNFDAQRLSGAVKAEQASEICDGSWVG